MLKIMLHIVGWQEKEQYNKIISWKFFILQENATEKKNRKINVEE